MSEREYSLEVQKGTEVITLDFDNGMQALSIADAIYDAAKKSGESLSVTVYPTGRKHGHENR